MSFTPPLAVESEVSRMRRKVLTLLPWVTLVLWLGQMLGCVARNQVQAPLEAAPAVDLDEPGAPLLGVARNNWPVHVAVVPCRTVEHGPTYTSYPRLVDSTVRARGEYPGPTEAVQMPDAEALRTQILEVPYCLAVAAVDVVIFPIRLIVQPPWQTDESPLLQYERKPVGWFEATAAPAPASAEPEADLAG